MALRRKKKKRALPYWLYANEQRCEGCGHQHALAVEARCVACDQPHCPICIVIIAGEAFCPQCHPEGGSRWRHVRSGKG